MCQRFVFLPLGRPIFDTPHEDRGPRGGELHLVPPSFDRPPPRWPPEASLGSKRPPRGLQERPKKRHETKKHPRGTQAAPERPQRAQDDLHDGSR
eukprot:3666724-Pyramimonas_sp.AAC.2